MWAGEYIGRVRIIEFAIAFKITKNAATMQQLALMLSLCAHTLSIEMHSGGYKFCLFNT